MLKKNLSKNTTKSKTISNENINKDSLISNKINFTDNELSPKNILKNEEESLENEKEKNINEKTEDTISMLTEYNEFSIFNSNEENQLKSNNDDKKIYDYLIKNYKTKENVDEFMDFFYPEGFKDTPDMKAVEFFLVGVFEDLLYYPVWMSDKLLINTIKELKSKYDIFYWRRIKGDGNCYYRSILINYIEILITNSIKKDDPSIFFCFIKEIFFSKFPKEKICFQKKLLTILLLIYEHIQKKSSFAYDILYRCIHKSQFIEKCIIFWFKLKLSEFLRQNINLEINGLKLVQAIPEINCDDDNTVIEPDNKELNDYIKNKILKMDEYVDGYPIYITPFVLKCIINIYSLNKSVDKKNNNIIININKEKLDLPKDTMYIPVINYLPNLKNEEINILFRSPHYDSLGNREFVNKLVDIYVNPYIILVEGILTLNEYEKYKTLIVEHWIEKKHKEKEKKFKPKHFSNNSCSKYVKPSIIKEEIEDKEEDEINDFKQRVLHTESEYKNDSIKRHKNSANLESKKAIKAYKTLNKFKDTNISSYSTTSIQMKYLDKLTKCSNCNDCMNHRLPCGCLICHSCSKKKILSFHKDNDIKIPLSVCPCGYILNDKDQKIIINQ